MMKPRLSLPVILALAIALSACGKKTTGALPPPPEPIIVEVAVPVPCDIASVDQPDYPANRARKGDDLFTLAKIAAADRQVLKGEVKELRAANDANCGETK